MVALVTHTIAQSPDSNAITTGAIDTTSGTLLVAMVTYYQPNKAALAISDSKGNTWVAIATAEDSGGGGGGGMRMYYVKNPTVGAGHTFTGGGTATYSSIFVLAFSGTDTTALRDQENAASTLYPATVTTKQPGSVTPTADGEVLVTGLSHSSVAGATYSIDSGFAISDQASDIVAKAFGGAFAYLVQGTAAAINPTWTANAADQLEVGIDTFKAAAGGAVQQRLMLVGVGS